MMYTDDYVTEVYFANNVFMEIESMYYDLFGVIEPIKHDSLANALTPPRIIKRLNLPPIEIPSFSGNYQDWIPFKELFVAVVDGEGYLSDVQKLHYLKSNLTGEAARVI